MLWFEVVKSVGTTNTASLTVVFLVRELGLRTDDE